MHTKLGTVSIVVLRDALASYPAKVHYISYMFRLFFEVSNGLLGTLVK